MNLLFECKSKQEQEPSFSLEGGMILGVIGQNGCGKTTLLKQILGLDATLPVEIKNTKEFYIAGKSLAAQRALYQQKVAYVLAETPFDENETPETLGFLYGRFYDGFDKKRYHALLAEYEVPKEKTIQELSLGQKMRQQIAFALSYLALVYVMDEPAGNLDTQFRDQFYRIIRELVEKEDKCVILSSHLVEELEQLADYILWLESPEEPGKMSFFGTIDELIDKYLVLQIEEKELAQYPMINVIQGMQREHHSEYLIKNDMTNLPVQLRESARMADLREIMYYTARSKKE